MNRDSASRRAVQSRAMPHSTQTGGGGRGLIAPHRGWDASTNVLAEEVGRAADLYVFCLLAERDQARVDPLDVSQWQFWVLSSRVLTERLGSQKTAALSTLEKAGAVPFRYEDLDEGIRTVV